MTFKEGGQFYIYISNKTRGDIIRFYKNAIIIFEDGIRVETGSMSFYPNYQDKFNSVVEIFDNYTRFNPAYSDKAQFLMNNSFN